MKIQNRKLDVIDTLCIVMIVVMGLLFVGSKVMAGEVADNILWTVQETDNIRIYKGGKITEAYTSPEYRFELEAAFLSASDKYNLPVYLLIAMAYYETMFRNQTGDNGRSLGIMQVGKMGRRKCQCDMDTVHGQIHCGACWLNMGRDWCGSLDGGLYAYINGTCNPKNTRAKRAFTIRKRLQFIIEKKFNL
jgi:hypothetical protein